MMSEKEALNAVGRLRWIDNVRGFAALLVVIGHTVVWSGLDSHAWIFRMVYVFISSFHMTIFFALSGYIAGRTKGIPDWKNFGCRVFIKEGILRRAVNMAVPTIVFGIITFVMVLVLGKLTVSKAISIALLWFIWTMIIVDVGHPILYAIFKKEKFAIPFLILCTAICGVVHDTLGMLSGYFLTYEIGVCLGHRLTGDTEKHFFKRSFAAVSFLLAMLMIGFSYAAFGENMMPSAFYRVPVGLMMCYTVFSLFMGDQPVAILERGGKASLQIYLFQVAAFRWLQTHTPALPLWADCIIFVMLVCGSFCVPIFLVDRLRDTRIYKILFSPYSYIQRLFKKAERG